MAIKTDMSKAFDRIEWSYLEGLMVAMGFSVKWINWIMTCITTVSYSVLINNQPHGLISPQRGLRQGDPLSPFLFVLCTEGLIHLLNQAESAGRLSGLRFSIEAPAIHHLLFADDSLFICRADVDQCKTLQQILQFYGRATGQMVNLDKSSITFGSKVSLHIKRLVKEQMGIFNEGGAGTYLGLPECFSGSKQKLLGYIQDKLKNRLSSWCVRHLSQGGKEILLKAIAMALPVYSMSCFRLPKATCKALSSVMAAYWWNALEGQNKIYWISWNKLCFPKSEGGLGFKDIGLFNQALLAKQAWRILQDPLSLVSKFLKSRYFKNNNILQAPIGRRPSYAWRSILHGRDLLIKGTQPRIGNGKYFSVWSTAWIEDRIMRPPVPKSRTVDMTLKICSLIDPISGLWSKEKLEELFHARDVTLISKIKPCLHIDDYYAWKYTKSGNYSPKSGYWLADSTHNHEAKRWSSQLPSTNTIKCQVWQLLIPSKIKVFIWKVLNNAVSSAENLLKRGIRYDCRCQLCGEDQENTNHTLFSCPFARQVWALSNIPSPENGFGSYSIYQNISYVLQVQNSHNPMLYKCKLGPWILWYLWKNRNAILFEGQKFSTEMVIRKCEIEEEQWRKAQEKEPRKTPPRILRAELQSLPIEWLAILVFIGIIVQNWLECLGFYGRVQGNVSFTAGIA